MVWGWAGGGLALRRRAPVPFGGLDPFPNPTGVGYGEAMNPTAYRMIGTTNDVIDCARCGKPDLRMTVVIALLDTDGNEEGVTYYGTSCAARVLAGRGVRTTAAKIRDEARAAQAQLEREAADSRRWLAELGLPVAGDVDAAAFEAALGTYRNANRIGGVTPRSLEWCRTALTESIARRQAQIAAAA